MAEKPSLEELWKKAQDEEKKRILVEKVAPAIKRQENFNGVVKSKQIDTRDQTIRNSVANNYDRWKKKYPEAEQGKGPDFVTFMAEEGGPYGKGWAKVGAPNDPKNLNKNWIPGVKSIIKQQQGPEEYKAMDKLNLVLNTLNPFATETAEAADTGVAVAERPPLEQIFKENQAKQEERPSLAQIYKENKDAAQGIPTLKAAKPGFAGLSEPVKFQPPEPGTTWTKDKQGKLQERLPTTMASVTRDIMGGTPLNQFKKYSELVSTPGLTNLEYERKARQTPVMDQLEDPITLGVAMAGIAAPAQTLKAVASYALAQETAQRTILPLINEAKQYLEKKPVKYQATALRDLMPPGYRDMADVTEFLIYGAGAKGMTDYLKTPRVRNNLAFMRYRVLKTLGVKQQTGLVPLTPDQLKTAFGETSSRYYDSLTAEQRKAYKAGRVKELQKAVKKEYPDFKTKEEILAQQIKEQAAKDKGKTVLREAQAPEASAPGITIAPEPVPGVGKAEIVESKPASAQKKPIVGKEGKITLYHGSTGESITTNPVGRYYAEEKGIAEKFGKITHEITIDKSKLLDITDVKTVGDMMDRTGGYIDINPFSSIQKETTIKELGSQYKALELMIGKKQRKELIDKGYVGIRFIDKTGQTKHPTVVLFRELGPTSGSEPVQGISTGPAEPPVPGIGAPKPAKVKPEKPVKRLTLQQYVLKEYGGVNPKKASDAGYPHQSFKEFGRLGVLRKDSKYGLDEIADSMVRQGLLNVKPTENPSDALMHWFQYEKDRLVGEAQTLDSQFAKEHDEWLAKQQKENPDADIPGVVQQIEGELSPDLEKEIASEEEVGADWGMEQPGEQLQFPGTEPTALTEKIQPTMEQQLTAQKPPAGDLFAEGHLNVSPEEIEILHRLGFSDTTISENNKTPEGRNIIASYLKQYSDFIAEQNNSRKVIVDFLSDGMTHSESEIENAVVGDKLNPMGMKFSAFLKAYKSLLKDGTLVKMPTGVKLSLPQETPEGKPTTEGNELDILEAEFPDDFLDKVFILSQRNADKYLSNLRAVVAYKAANPEAGDPLKVLEMMNAEDSPAVKEPKKPGGIQYKVLEKEGRIDKNLLNQHLKTYAEMLLKKLIRRDGQEAFKYWRGPSQPRSPLAEKVQDIVVYAYNNIAEDYFWYPETNPKIETWLNSVAQGAVKNAIQSMFSPDGTRYGRILVSVLKKAEDEFFQRTNRSPDSAELSIFMRRYVDKSWDLDKVKKVKAIRDRVELNYESGVIDIVRSSKSMKEAHDRILNEMDLDISIADLKKIEEQTKGGALPDIAEAIVRSIVEKIKMVEPEAGKRYGLSDLIDVSEEELMEAIGIGEAVKGNMTERIRILKEAFQSLELPLHYILSNPKLKATGNAILDASIKRVKAENDLRRLADVSKKTEKPIELSEIVTNADRDNTRNIFADLAAAQKEGKITAKDVEAYKKGLYMMLKKIRNYYVNELMASRAGVRMKSMGKRYMVQYTKRDGKVSNRLVTGIQLDNLKERYGDTRVVWEKEQVRLTQFDPKTNAYTAKTKLVDNYEEAIELQTAEQQALIKEILPYRLGNWIPHNRTGNWWVIVHEKLASGDEPVEIFAARVPNQTIAAKMGLKIRQQFPMSNVEVRRHSEKMNTYPSFGSMVDVQIFMASLGIKPESEHGQRIINAYRAMSPVMKHLIHAKNIPGFRIDWPGIIEGTYALTKSVISREFKQDIKDAQLELEKIRESLTDFEYNSTRKFLDALTMVGESQPMLDFLKATAYFSVLANSPTYIAQNLTEPVWALADALSRMKHPASIMKPLNHEYKMLIDRAKKEGLLKTFFLEEIAQGEKKGENALRWIDFLGRSSERHSSKQVFEIGLKVARDLGLSGDDAYNFASRYLFHEGKPYYSQANKPIAILGPGWTGFRQYGFVLLNWTLWWINNFLKGSMKKKVLLTLATMLMSGGSTFPFGKRILEKTGAVRPTYKAGQLGPTQHSFLEKTLLYGLPASLFGVSTRFLRPLSPKGLQGGIELFRAYDILKSKFQRAQSAYKNYGLIGALYEFPLGGAQYPLRGAVQSKQGILKRGKVEYMPKTAREKGWMQAGFTPLEYEIQRQRKEDDKKRPKGTFKM